MTRALRNENGMALIITLMVVAILTIIVMEFTFSAQVDQHMVRNSMSGLQASLLARSGVNMGEAFLLHDVDPQIDAFTEEWCPAPGPQGESCLIDETNSGIVIPENMRLRVQIFDEGAKFSVNLTKPVNVGEYKTYMAWKANPNPAGMRPFQRRLALLGELIQSNGGPPEAVDSLEHFWSQMYDQLIAESGGAPATGTDNRAQPNVASNPATTGTNPQPQQPQTGLNALTVPDFPTLDDVGIVPGLTPLVLRKLRPLVTAYDTIGLRGGAATRSTFLVAAPININTAPRRLLQFLLIDPAVVDQIISARQEAPIRDARSLVQQAAAQTSEDENRRDVASLFGAAQSTLFLIRASAVINSNPLTGKGGIGRTASVIVRRTQKPGVGPNPPPGVSRWTLTRIEWQKEGGAALFRDDALDLTGIEGSPSERF